jgi:DNA-directed RNA polymerase subunit F
MITEEIIYKVNQEKEFVKIKHDLAAAIQAIDTAIVHLTKTEEYDSETLDYAVDELMQIKQRLKALLGD